MAVESGSGSGSSLRTRHATNSTSARPASADPIAASASQPAGSSSIVPGGTAALEPVARAGEDCLPAGAIDPPARDAPGFVSPADPPASPDPGDPADGGVDAPAAGAGDATAPPPAGGAGAGARDADALGAVDVGAAGAAGCSGSRSGAALLGSTVDGAGVGGGWREVTVSVGPAMLGSFHFSASATKTTGHEPAGRDDTAPRQSPWSLVPETRLSVTVRPPTCARTDTAAAPLSE